MAVRFTIAAASVAALCVLAGAAQAAGDSAPAEDPPYVKVGIGEYDIFHDNQAGDFDVEYRFQRLWVFRPVLGVELTTDSAVYGYGGFNFKIPLGEKFLALIGTAVGAYSNGNGKDLGSAVEFRSGAEFDYQFSNGPRLGIAIHHISNAGLGSDNPGTEILSLVYSFPFEHRSGGQSARR